MTPILKDEILFHQLIEVFLPIVFDTCEYSMMMRTFNYRYSIYLHIAEVLDEIEYTGFLLPKVMPI